MLKTNPQDRCTLNQAIWELEQMLNCDDFITTSTSHVVPRIRYQLLFYSSFLLVLKDLKRSVKKIRPTDTDLRSARLVYRHMLPKSKPLKDKEYDGLRYIVHVLLKPLRNQCREGRILCFRASKTELNECKGCKNETYKPR